MKSIYRIAAICLLAGTSHANAALLTNASSISSPLVATFNDISPAQTGTTGPVQVGNLLGLNIEFVSTPFSSIGQLPTYNLGANGTWGAGRYFAATDNGGTMEFNFLSGPVSSVGAILSHRRTTSNTGSVFIHAYNSTGDFLEGYAVNFTASSPTAINEGGFFGISRNIADIASFRVSDGFVAVDDLTFSAPVPEPSAYGMMGVGMLLLIAKLRRSQKQHHA